MEYKQFPNDSILSKICCFCFKTILIVNVKIYILLKKTIKVSLIIFYLLVEIFFERKFYKHIVLL